MKKRFMASALVVAMVLTMLTGLTFAADGDVAMIGDTGYATLAEAIKNATSGDEIILKAGTYEMPDEAKNKTFTIRGSETGVTINIKDDGSYEHCDYSADGANITFKNVTLNARTVGENNYRGYARCSLTCIECTINGELTLYGKSSFTDCVFNATGDIYNVWTWGAKEATFTRCTFNCDGKSLLVYNQAVTVNIDTCTFNDKGGLEDCKKAAIETGHDGNSPRYIINVTNSKVNGFAINDAGSNTNSTLFGNKNSLGESMTVTVDNMQFWPDVAYTINMNGNGGKLSNSNGVFLIKNQFISGNVELSNPGFTKLGYELSGWKTGTGAAFGTGEVSVADLAAADKNKNDTTIYITAQWSPKDFTINMNGGNGKLNNGYKVYQFTANYEGTATLIDPGYTYLGYKLAGWKIGGTVYPIGSDVAVSDLLALDKNKTDEVIYLSAVWEPGDYILNFNGGAGKNDGKKVLQVNVKSTDKVVLGDIDGNYIREGYTLVGWDSGSTGHEYDLTTEYVVLDLLKNDKNPYDNTIYLSAQWDANPYTITFNTDGGSAIDPITADYGTAVTAPADPTKTGYTFAGWEPEIPATMPAENVTVKAKWTVNQYTITFDTDGGSKIDPITADYGTAVTAPANPTKEGYTFAGWDAEVPATVPAENLTIKAQWTINPYTITFDTDGGSAIEAITQDYGTAVTAPADPTKTGYTFAGWVDEQSNPAEVPATMPAKDMTLTAVWQINSYNYRIYDKDTGKTLYTGTEEFGTEVDLTAKIKPSKGYHIGAWEVKNPEKWVVKANAAIWVEFAPNAYTVKFDSNGGIGEMADQARAYQDKQPLTKNVFTREGYTFTGWNTKADGTGSSYDDEAKYTLVSKDNAVVTLYAQWTVNTYGVTYKANGGEGADYTSKAVFGEKFTMAENEFTREGYTFSGWNTKKDGTGVSYTAGKSYTKTSAKNLVVYAQWTVNPYTLNVDNANDTEVITKTVNYGETVTLETPVWEGHTFSCWMDADGNVVASSFTMPAYDLTVKAVWDTNVYTVTYLDGFGKTFTTFNVPYGAKVPVAASPIVPGYDFMGWTPSVPKTMPASNLTFTAQWQLSACKVTVNMTGNGFVSSNYNLNAVPYGASVTLTLTPATNYVYIYVNGEKLTGNTYTFTVTDDVTIDVTFEMESFIYHNQNTTSSKSWYEKMLEIYANSLK